MKILQVCAYAAPYEGNFIASLKALEKKALEKGHKTIYAFPETAKDKDWCKTLAERTSVYFLPLSKARIRFSTYRKLKKIYKDNPDLGIIHCHFELYDVPVVLTAKKNVKVFWHLHDAIGDIDDRHNRFAQKMQYKFLHKKAILLSVSEKHKDFTIGLGFPKEQAKYVPNGLNTDAIGLIDTDYESRQKDFLLFGWEYERKGVDLCVKAHKELSNRYNIAVVGKSNTQELINNEFGLVDNLEVVPPVENVNLYYRNSKCFLHISRAEGLSYALLEAIYSGLPVVCSNIKENMFAEEFPTVYMVENENVLSISQGMDLVVKKGLPSREDVNLSRKIIEEKYSIKRWTEDVLNFYGI